MGKRKEGEDLYTKEQEILKSLINANTDYILDYPFFFLKILGTRNTVNDTNKSLRKLGIDNGEGGVAGTQEASDRIRPIH